VEQVFQGAQTIDRGARLLAAVLDADAAVGTGDLATATELPKSTASRLLAALERHGLVQQDGHRGRFTAGPVVLRFAQRGLVERNLAELAQPALQALSDASGETINLAVPGPRGVEHLAQIDTTHFLGTGHWVGRTVPYHRTANGRVLVAFGATTPPADQRLPDEELEAVRRDGVATASEQLEPGLTSIAAPVLGATGCLAALSISGPTLRLTAARIDQLRPALLEQARALSEQLGHDHQGAHAA
jgi:IclR family acetate operon transcriptional repressor